MALDFNGINQSLSVPIDLSAYSAVTIAFCLRPDAWASTNGNYNEIYNLTGSGFSANGGFVYYLEGGTNYFGDVDTVNIGHGGPSGLNLKLYNKPAVGQWSRAVCVHDFTQDTNNEVLYYLNGALQTQIRLYPSSVNNNAASKFADSTLYMAASGSSTNYFDGRIAEIAVWGSALSAQDAAIYDAGYSPAMIKPSSLVGYWKLLPGDGQRQWWKGSAMSSAGSPSDITHPNMIYPSSPKILYRQTVTPQYLYGPPFFGAFAGPFKQIFRK